MFPIRALDRPEHDEGHAHPCAFHLAAERLGEARKGVARGSVGASIGPGEIGGRRGDTRDRATPACEHLWQEGACEVKGREIRHLDHGQRLLRRRLDQRQPAAGPGIVDEDVGCARLARDPGADLIDGLRIGEVYGEGGGRAALPPDILGHAAKPLGSARKQQHAGAACGVAFCRCLADPARGPGYQDELGYH